MCDLIYIQRYRNLKIYIRIYCCNIVNSVSRAILLVLSKFSLSIYLGRSVKAQHLKFLILIYACDKPFEYSSYKVRYLSLSSQNFHSFKLEHKILSLSYLLNYKFLINFHDMLREALHCS